MAYSIYCKDHFYDRFIPYHELKIKEAYCRSLQLDYEIKYPDGTILECKFRK